MFQSCRAPFAAVAIAVLALAAGPVLAQDSTQAPAEAPAQQGDRLDREGRHGRAGKGGGRRDRGNRGSMFGRAAEFLGLTDEQRTRIDEIRKADGDSLKAAHATLAEKRKSLEEAVAADPVSQASVDARILEVSAAQTEMMRVSTATRLKVMQVLTPEQRTKLRDARGAHRSRGFKR